MTAPLLLLNVQSPVPPYEQIRVQLRMLITSGHLAAGATLPSVRQLASDLAVAPNTVVRAYKELEREGWVIPAARKGVMVADRPPIMTPQERRRCLEEAVAEFLALTRHLEASLQEVTAELERQWSRAIGGGLN